MQSGVVADQFFQRDFIQGPIEGALRVDQGVAQAATRSQWTGIAGIVETLGQGQAGLEPENTSPTVMAEGLRASFIPPNARAACAESPASPVD